MAIFGVVILLWNTFQGGKSVQKELPFSEFTSAVKKGEVSEVTIRGKQLSGKFSGRSAAGESQYAAGEFKTQLPTIRIWSRTCRRPTSPSRSRSRGRTRCSPCC